jgi:hypothetical protein
MAGSSLSKKLSDLHNTYVWEVNAAVQADDDDHVERLADEYTERALRLITSQRVAS